MSKNVIDFPDKRAIEEEACRWIVRFEADEQPSQADIDALNEWITRDPVHREVLLKYVSLWEEMDLLSELMVPLKKLKNTTEHPSPKFKRCLMLPVVFLGGTFACVRSLKQIVSLRPVPTVILLFLALAGATLLAIISNNQSHFEQDLSTSVGERLSRQLQDGSTIWLNTESSVMVRYSMGERRIYLQKGEGYFDVAKDESRPFKVYAGSRLIRAVGTAFSVYKQGHEVKVTVTEGQVDLAIVLPNDKSHDINSSSSISQSNGNSSLLAQKQVFTESEEVSKKIGSLSAGQSVILPEEGIKKVDKVINHDEKELSRQISWRDGLLVFTGEPLSEVVEEVSRYTPIEITVKNPDLRAMRIGGQFQIGETEALFDILESGFGLQVSRLDENHVEIH